MMQWVSLRQAQEEAAGTIAVKQHWYLTEDKTRVVEEGHPDGRWLWASPGTVVKLSDALRLGAVQVQPEPEKSTIEKLVEDGMDPEKVAKAVKEKPVDLDEELPEADEKPAEEPKAAKQAPNKAAKKAPNKGATAEDTKDA